MTYPIKFRARVARDLSGGLQWYPAQERRALISGGGLGDEVVQSMRFLQIERCTCSVSAAAH